MEALNEAKPKLGISPSPSKITGMAEARILAIVRSPEIYRDLGQATFLLVHIVERCGDEAACLLNYGELALLTGIPAPTLKKWGNDLDAKGVIQKTKAAHGVHVSLAIERLLRVNPSEHYDAQNVARTVDILLGLRSTLGAAIDGALGQLQALAGSGGVAA